MNGKLPDSFVSRMRQQLGEELPAFLHALEEAPLRGIRFNPLKSTAAEEKYASCDPVPWADNAYYLPYESTAGASVFHEAGAYYIQEPAAMLPAAVLSPKPGEFVLDLCAAPGGKSTQIGCMMKGEGLLVCNEPVPGRARILSGNIERIGLPNTVVTCAWPESLAEKWPGAFDAVLVDAPCSGEGMFRRDPETRNEWTTEKAEGCAARQREILAAAARLVRPGGRLVYSTCTYHPSENEENARWFTDSFPEFSAEAFTLPGISAPEGLFTCYPHRLKGEGQFAALFRKDGEAAAKRYDDQSLPRPSGNEQATFRDAFPSFPLATHMFGKTLVNIPFLPDMRGVRTLRIGLHLGEVRGKTAVPDHASALCFRTPQMQAFELDQETVLRYLAGETVPGDHEGWVLLRYRGAVLGWGKGSEGIIKNHYPKGLRKQRLIP